MTAALPHPMRPTARPPEAAALDSLRAGLERVFLDAGETLIAMEARFAELRGPLAELVDRAPCVIEAADGYARQLARSVGTLDDDLGRCNGDLDTLRRQVDALSATVATVARSVRMMQFVTTNARIQVFALRPRHAKLESFADNARALLDHSLATLADVQAITVELSSHLRNLARRRLPGLRAEVAALRPGFEALCGAVAGFREDRRNESAFGRPLAALLDRLQAAFDGVIVSLQTGDRASQRIDHAGQIHERAASDPDAGWLVGLADAQLAGAFGDLRDETATITATLAASVGRFDEIAGNGGTGSVEGRLRAFADLRSAVERARLAVEAIRSRREGVLASAESVTGNIADLRRVLADVSSLAEDLRLVGTNAVLACAELGGEGAALREIAGQLRLLASDSAAQLREMRDALSDSDARISDLIGELQGRTARTIAGIEGAGAAVASDLDRVCQAGRIVTDGIAALASSLHATVPETCEAMQAQVACLADLAASPGAAALPSAGADPDAELVPFWLLYSMESEREIHRDFCRGLGLAEPGEVGVGPPEELDIFF
ncbi:hypothetical protein NHN26_11485 [Rhodovulum tesquicola]|uniref:hypothetical protein n=1 Tax=Rhodovulum tesquicola TaxID=540254 RepID=UPI002096DAC1|nr:hypothetical protein [Rhodovulum tesquicola]MCO8145849.1 hypothetical protein [Rhodovulum tesquicola]